MNAVTPMVMFATSIALGILSAVLGRRARRLEARLQSLSHPLHEVRGALAALELGLSFMERGSGRQEQLNGCVDSLRLSLERATFGIRDADAIRRGDPALVAVRDEVDFSSLVLRSARAWSLLAPSYGASLDVDWRAGHVRILGHAGRLQQALDNLFANALEHGGGRVFVEGELRGGIVRVLVSDGGGGLPQDPDELLTNGSSSGRGHGLSIVRKAIHEHNGTLALAMGRNGPGLLVELPTTDPREAVPGRIALRHARSTAGDRASKAA